MGSRDWWKLTVDVAAIAGLVAALGFGCWEHVELTETREQLRGANSLVEEANRKSSAVLAALTERDGQTSRSEAARKEADAAQLELVQVKTELVQTKADKSMLAAQVDCLQKQVAEWQSQVNQLSDDQDKSVNDLNKLVDDYNALATQKAAVDVQVSLLQAQLAKRAEATNMIVANMPDTSN